MQVVVVCGGAGGIGASTVQRFLNDGAKVALVDMNENAASKVLEELAPLVPVENAKIYLCDVSKRDECFRVADQVAQDFGRINHLINAVAYFGSEVKDNSIFYSSSSSLLNSCVISRVWIPTKVTGTKQCRLM